MKSMYPSHNNTTHNKIKLTHHSLQRSMERLNTQKTQQIKKLAYLAKKNGINIKNINPTNYNQLNLTKQQYSNLKKYFKSNQSGALYYYKGYVWVFSGNNNMTLKTVINFNIDRK